MYVIIESKTSAEHRKEISIDDIFFFELFTQKARLDTGNQFHPISFGNNVSYILNETIEPETMYNTLHITQKFIDVIIKNLFKNNNKRNVLEHFIYF